MSIINYIDIIGTVVFAISGWYTATEKQLDVFGASIIALVTAIGGGTLRDILLGNSPVTWLTSTTPIYCIFAGIITAVIGGSWLNKIRKTIFLFDSIGLGMFTILGLQQAMTYDISTFSAVLLGVISATAGGVIRDILCNEIPLIFREELYATPCIIGAVLYILGVNYTDLPQFSIIMTCISSTVLLRIIAVYKGWSMPVAFTYKGK